MVNFAVIAGLNAHCIYKNILFDNNLTTIAEIEHILARFGANPAGFFLCRIIPIWPTLPIISIN